MPGANWRLGSEGALHGALEDPWLAARILRALHRLPPAPMRLHGSTNMPREEVVT